MSKKKKKLKKAIAAAGPTISKGEYEKIVQAAGGNTKKAINKISKAGSALNTGTANMLIKQATSAPPFQPVNFGSSALGQELQSRVGTPSTRYRDNKGQMTYGGAGTPGLGTYNYQGMVITPKGKIAPKSNFVPQQDLTDLDEYWAARNAAAADRRAARQQPVANPNQGLLDEIAGLSGRLDDQDIMYQNMFDQSQAAYQQQMAEMSNMMNAQIAQAQQAYAQSVAAAEAEALQQQEAARAFMINQGRAVSPANLQIGSMYSQPRIGGTQAFKYSQPRPTSSLDTTPVATAFTAPTLAASLQQPAVLNV